MKDPQKKWSLEEIKEGLERYKKENGRYPTTIEVDSTMYLPSSRQIQRRFGGLVAFRKELRLSGPDDFTKGEYRSAVAAKLKRRSYEIEEEFYNYLLTIYPKINIHEQMRLRPGNIASDFYIYLTENTGYAIDIFNAIDMHSLTKIINIKLKRYTQIKDYNIYFIAVGEFLQGEVDKFMKNKKIKLPANIKVLCIETFKDTISSIT